MSSYITFIIEHRRAVVAAVVLVTVAFATQLSHLELEIRRRANLPSHHPYVEIQNQISDIFGGEGVVIIGVFANQGSLYTKDILGKIWRITERLEDVPGVIEGSLFGIAAPSAKVVLNGGDGTLDVHPLMSDHPPESAAEIERIRHDIENDPFFRGNLVSFDESATAIVLDFDDTVTDSQIVQGINEAIQPEKDDSLTIALAGSPVLRVALTQYTALIAILFPIAVVVIGLVHYEAFRTLQAVFLPIVTALLSVIWALGIMGALRQPMDTWSAMTPVLILAIAAGHAVQILKRYYEEYSISGNNDQAIIRAVSAVGPVALTAGLIASAGFASLITFDVTSVRVFGLLLASGIVSSLVIEMTFTPACRSLLPAPRKKEVLRERQQTWLDLPISSLADYVVAQPGKVLMCAAAILLFSGVGALRLEVDNSIRYWFPPENQIRQDDRLLNEKLPGTATLRILVEAENNGGIEEPSVLDAISDLQLKLESERSIGGVTSVANLVERMNRAMHDGDSRYYRIPEKRRLVTEYLFLYELSAGPDGLAAFIDSNHRYAVIRALSKTDSSAFSRNLIRNLETFAATRFSGLPVRVGIAGGTLGVQTALNDVVVRDKVANIIQVAAIILILSAVVLRSIAGGVFVLMPLTVAVVVNLGIMGWARIQLDMATAAITAMGVSIGADFAIYLIFRIREELDVTKSLPIAIASSLRTSGKGIFFVASAVTMGYLVLPFSGFSIWMRLGILTATMVIVSALATLTILPAATLLQPPAFLMRSGHNAPRR